MKNKGTIGAAIAVLLIGGVVGCGSNGMTESPGGTTSPQNGVTSPAETPNPEGTGQQQLLAIEEVERLALEQVEGDGWVQSIHLESERNTLYYDVEVETETHDYDIDLDALTGEALSVEQELDTNTAYAETAISLQQAVTIALDQTQGEFRDVERKQDAGRVYYEVETGENGKETEVKIDAETGEIIKAKVDR